MKRPIFALFACAAALSAPRVLAEQVQNLQETEVPVVSQGEEARHAGFVEAFETVLIKLSGSGETPRHLPEAIKAPEKYVEQFRFTTNAATGAPALWVRFDGRAVDQLLREKGLPVWGGNRPALITWLAVEEKGRRTLVGTADTGPVAVAVRSAAERRAMPVHLPAADAEDLGVLPPDQIFAGSLEAVQMASARYHAQAVLTGALSKESDTLWRARWFLYRDGLVLRRWETQGALDAVVNGGMNGAADELSRSFAVPMAASGQGVLAVQVSGVTTLEQFIHVSNYIRSLPGVTSVQPAEVTAEQVVLSVAFQGAAEGLAQAVAAGDTLVAAPGAAPAQELSYRLLK